MQGEGAEGPGLRGGGDRESKSSLLLACTLTQQQPPQTSSGTGSGNLYTREQVRTTSEGRLENKPV